jgi:glycosyltransferase involved in cell wall biosynthesis
MHSLKTPIDWWGTSPALVPSKLKAMEKILLINYYWPPCGGPAVQRWLDITNYIEAKGIQTYVVTIDEKVATFPSYDASLQNRIAKSTKVFKTDTSELFDIYKKFVGNGKVPTTGLVDEPNPGFLKKVARFIRGNFFLPDPRIGWNKHAYKMAKTLIEQHNIKVVFTAGPPQSTHLVGLKLKREFPHVKWVTDIHDYWTEVSHLKLFYRTKIATYFDRKLERKVLVNADVIMTHCRSSKKIFSERIKEIEASKIFVHTMGFNEALFQPRPRVKQNEFVIAYVGSIGAHYEPGPFLKAFKKAVGSCSGIPIKLKFVGSCSQEIKNLILSEKLEKQTEETGYLPHQLAVDYLFSSSALLLINPKFGQEKIHVPGKLYEYLAAFKPIVSISPSNSESEQIIKQMNAGKNFERGDIDGIAGYLIQLIKEWEEKKEIDLPVNDEVFRYSRKEEAFLLADRIKNLTNA